MGRFPWARSDCVSGSEIKAVPGEATDRQGPILRRDRPAVQPERCPALSQPGVARTAFQYIRAVQYSLDRFDLDAEQVPGDTVAVVALFDDVRGCEKFAQRLLSFRPGRSRERREPADDEVLYVLSGSGTISVGGSSLPLREGVGVHLGRGTGWSVEAGEELELLSVLVHDPLPVAPGSPRARRSRRREPAQRDRRPAVRARGQAPSAAAPRSPSSSASSPPGAPPTTSTATTR